MRDGVSQSGSLVSGGGVPEFRQYFSTYKDMGDAQRDFYERTLKPAFLRGDRVDLEGNLSYGFVLASELVGNHGYRDLSLLRNLFHRLALFYRGTSLGDRATTWVADAYFLEHDYQAGFDTLVDLGHVDLRTYIGVAEDIVDSRVTGEMAWGWTTADRLRPYGVRHKNAVLDVLERLLDEEHAKRGRSIVSDLWIATAVERRSGDPAAEWVVDVLDEWMLAEQLGVNLSFMDLYGGRPRMAAVADTSRRDVIAQWETQHGERQREAFEGLLAPTAPYIRWPSASASGFDTKSTYGFHLIVRAYLHKRFREAENEVRENSGVPRVGEGWVSEVELFRRLRDAFPETRVTHQGRPAWLRPQSIDILFPDWQIAVEYQGEQHHRPIEIFGGQTAFEVQLERDARKRKTCREHDHVLIEVLPGHDIDDVVARIREARPG